MNLLDELSNSYPLLQLVATFIAFVLYLILRRILSKVVLKRALVQNFDPTRVLYVKKSVQALLYILLLVLLGIIWEISLKGLSLYVASFVTLIGVGLFATWSILSNVTASVVLFFFFPFKIGSKVKIVDGDNSAEGTVVGLSLFSIRIEREDGKEIYYPNNLAMQKSIIHLN